MSEHFLPDDTTHDFKVIEQGFDAPIRNDTRNMFVTVVLKSTQKGPRGRFSRLQSIGETWGPDANAVIVVSQNEDNFDEIVALFPSIENKTQFPEKFPRSLLVPSSLGASDRGIERMAYILKAIYLHYFSHQQTDDEEVPSSLWNLDYVFVVNDQTFVLPSHLSSYLGLVGASPDEPLYLGHPLSNPINIIFNIGSAGYVMSRNTLGKVASYFGREKGPCAHIVGGVQSQNINLGFLKKNPALVLAKCLSDMGVIAVDSRDAENRHVFHRYC
eukprot:CAMPEP_0113316812 /NCGR_PEP_ID=MMETSP0010_2-20120614/11951_1 /TAXON_ID=216773 ORGANISM="Corethron hystrix, Strain 308" /NCGR_SAMPLE_ID=MMETSP0010_2 /ASSEMBLY_ACC=CAM_ASM_000155 /LENGTH=271 /DNA_ID=CAMNT_0000173629 /DNA_START=194 /DNA_END=1009 /DNA_ORIENTATION=- /assembly_acc=CAM_ASM_000155